MYVSDTKDVSGVKLENRLSNHHIVYARFPDLEVGLDLPGQRLPLVFLAHLHLDLASEEEVQGPRLVNVYTRVYAHIYIYTSVGPIQ